ncbi:Bug family tripartite tricarboxylate transporter substrate binding protein [Falsiroseomonas sp. HW251]|uniref:Bug family tripartite tricarboxylate transporter substrate binding protein n=1 Tax=Falsiroseomonas sp. HW251 TaxID=3390998 RepID=UPI003D31E662
MTALRRRTLLRAAAFAPLARPALAQTAPDPSRPVRVLVGAAAGGATDIITRIVTEAMAPDFPRGFAVENRPGAGGNIAAEVVARAAPDGYTLLMGDQAQTAINPALYRHVGFDPVRDFTPIVLVAEFPFVIVVNPAIPARTLAEFVAWAKAQPEPVLYGSPNAGSPHHLGMEALAKRLGFRVSHVPYRGGAPAVVDLLSGQLKVGSIGLPPLVPHLREGRLFALAVSTPGRSPLSPEVPTIAEAAVPGFAMPVWYGMLGPGGLPADILRHVEASVARAQARPEVAAKLAESGLTIRRGNAAEFGRFLTAEIAFWGEAARASGVTIE